MKRFEIKKLQEELPYGWSICSEVVLFTDHEEEVKRAVAAEREACARLAENTIEKYGAEWYDKDICGCNSAANIRQRSSK